MAGRCASGGSVGAEARELVTAERSASEPRFVSRGGIKLENAILASGLDVAGRRALDVGASTGGFTDCLLRRGAAEVIAVDVGYGQLAWTLRNDPRVSVLERTNARGLTGAMLPYTPDLATIDVVVHLARQGPAGGARVHGGRI